MAGVAGFSHAQKPETKAETTKEAKKKQDQDAKETKKKPKMMLKNKRPPEPTRADPQT